MGNLGALVKEEKIMKELHDEMLFSLDTDGVKNEASRNVPQVVMEDHMIPNQKATTKKPTDDKGGFGEA